MTKWSTVGFFITQEMQGNSILFVIAGHDTTATALSFLVYELALAPEIQDRVVAEIAEVLPDKVRNMYIVIEVFVLVNRY